MKKFLATLLVLTMVISLTACGKSEDNSSNGNAGTNNSSSSSDNTSNSDSSNATNTTDSTNKVEKEEVKPIAADATEILNKIWANHDEDMLFAIMGGYDEDFDKIKNMEAGKFNSDDAEVVDSFAGIPASDFNKTDDISLIMHAMNANTFTCTAYHVTDKNLVNTLAANYKENIMNRQWMCGFPDKLVVFTLEDYIIAFFGNEELVDNFKTKTIETYPSATLAFEEMITEGGDDSWWDLGL